MPEVRFPSRLPRPTPKADKRHCQAHRAWVRRHRCSVPGCRQGPIDCAHVRTSSNAGIGMKPADCWTISLCRAHHEEQHRIGQAAFELRYGLDLIELSKEFARRSPFRKRFLI